MRSRVIGLLGVLLCVLTAQPALAGELTVVKIEVSRDQVAPQQQKTFDFNIDAQPLDTALATFGQLTGTQILYSADITFGKSSSGVRGNMTADNALRSLLEGTSLSPVPTAHNAIMLVLDRPGATAALPANAPLLRLDTIRVDGRGTIDYMAYAANVRDTIRGVLQRDEAMRGRSYRGLLTVWISPSGTVQRCELVHSRGDAVLDSAITRVVQDMSFHIRPPANLPRPVYVWIATGSDAESSQRFVFARP